MTRVFFALVGTLAVLATHGLLIAALAGVGLLARRAFGLARATLDEWLTAFWLGFSLVLAFLIVWNFALPVGTGAFLTVVLIGLIGLWLDARLPSAATGTPMPRWAIGLFVLLALYIANRATGPMLYWDTAMYHAPVVKWARSFAVVPGLANLYGPLGFNNGSLLYDAMLEVGPWQGASWHVANGPLITALAAQALLGAVRFRQAALAERFVHLFQMLLLALALEQTAALRTPSFTTDLPVSLLLSQLMASSFALLVRSERDARRDSYAFFVVVLLATGAVATKVNATIFAGTSVAIMSVLWCRRRIRASRPLMRPLVYTFGVAGLFALAWLGRGVVLSGYPLFPSTALAAPVAWRVPLEHAQAEFALAAESARATTGNIDFVAGRSTGLRAWLPGWLTFRVPILELVSPVILVVLAFISALVGWLRAHSHCRAEVGVVWWLLFPPGIALIAWFVLAPEPRYASPYLWTLVALGLTQSYRLWHDRLGPRAPAFVVVFALVVGAIPIVLDGLTKPSPSRPRHGPLYTFVRGLVVIPEAGEFMPWSTWEARSKYTTRSGLVVDVAPTRCGFGELPCTPNPAPNLRLRIASRLDKGFVVDGAWDMQSWPWRNDREFLPAWREGKQRERSPDRR